MELDSPNPLQECLAYAATTDYRGWLGTPSPRALQALLIGAEDRVAFTKAEIPSWKVTGPLNDRAFYFPLVARTGRPSLSIRWSTALEILYYSLDDAMRELQTLLEAWASSHPLPAISTIAARPAASLSTHLSHLAQRPGMYLGNTSAWLLHCYLVGLSRGGDWLRLPPLPEVGPIIAAIEQRSESAYGSRFAAYRVHERNPEELLSWAGISPDDSPAPSPGRAA